MSYTENPDKPEALLANYTTVRGAELRQIYGLIDLQGGVPLRSIEERFARTPSGEDAAVTDHVENCLKFLRAIDLAELSGQNVVRPLNEEVYPELSFEARLLQHLCHQQGKQSHLWYVFDVLAGLDERRVPKQHLYESVQADESKSFGFQWTNPKINMWANLADSIGAISYVPGRENSRSYPDQDQVISSPTRALLYELLAWHANHGEDATRLLSALDWIDEEFLPLYASRAGTPEVSAGVASALRNMEAEGALSFRSMSDTQRVVGLPEIGGDSTENVATFTVDERPSTPAYAHPLDRETTEVVA